MSQDQLTVITSPMNEEARAYLRAKGCIITSDKTSANAHDHVKFPVGCYRSEEKYPRVRLALYYIFFPDESWIVEQRAIKSYLSLPINPTIDPQQ